MPAVPVTIRTVVATTPPDGVPQALALSSQPRQLTDEELAHKPWQYPLIADCALELLSIAAECLPLLSPSEDGRLPRRQLLTALRSALDEFVFDLHWRRNLTEQYAARHQAAQRRGLVARMREADELRAEALVVATEETGALREHCLSDDHLALCLEAMHGDGFVVAFQTAGGEWSEALPGTPLDAPDRAFHAEAVRAAILSHLAEVRRWNLPAPTTERRLALAREHSRILCGDSPRLNTMLGAELRRRLEQRLLVLADRADTRRAALFEILLAGRDLPREPQGGIDRYDLCRQLEPLVQQPDNIDRVLRGMAAEGLLRILPMTDDRTEYADPELDFLPLPESTAPPAPSPETVNELPEPGRAQTLSDFKNRFRLLRDLADEALITPDEYQRRKAELLSEI